MDIDTPIESDSGAQASAEAGARAEPLERDGAQSIDRAMALLVLVSTQSRVGTPIRDLVAQSGLKQPTVHRLLGALARAGLVEQDPDTRRYHLGCESYVLGTLAAERFGVHRLAVGSVVRLAQMSEDTAFLTVRRGDYAVCMHREEGTYPIRAQVLSVGDRHPLGIGAGSIALLAALGDAEIDRALALNEARYREHYPAITCDVLKALVRETREQGYAVHRGLVHPGSWGLGMVVRDEAGDPCAALSIGAIESRMGAERQRKLVRMLQTEVLGIEAHVKARYASRRAQAGVSAPTSGGAARLRERG